MHLIRGKITSFLIGFPPPGLADPAFSSGQLLNNMIYFDVMTTFKGLPAPLTRNNINKNKKVGDYFERCIQIKSTSGLHNLVPCFSVRMFLFSSKVTDEK